MQHGELNIKQADKLILNSPETSRLAQQAALTGSFWDMITLMDAVHPSLPVAEIQSRDGWRNLAMLGQFSFTLGNDKILRLAADCALRNADNTGGEDEMKLMSVCLANGSRIELNQLLPLLDDPSHNAHYLAARLGAIAFRSKDTDVVEACVKRLARQDQVKSTLVDPQMELEIMLACRNILRGEGYHRQRLLHALRITKPQWRQRYAQSMGALFGAS